METESTCETPSSDNLSSSCDNSFPEISDLTLSEQNSDTQSISVSNKISPLRGGSNCVEAGVPKSPSTNEDEQNIHSSCSGNNPDLTRIILNPPDVTLNTGEQSTSSCYPSNSTQLSSSRRVQNSPSNYHIKIIEYKTRKVPIITQNENGPCPLIAILNVLSLRDKISFFTNIEVISSEDLMNYFVDSILNYVQRNNSNSEQSVEQNVHDLMAIMPKLQTGLDVNIRFTGVKNFEYTPECDLFDLLNINLYHGWLAEQDEVMKAIGNCSYNQLVEKIIKNQSSTDPELKHDAIIAENFLENTAAQLTYHGLCELNSTLNEDELAVLFRNNHFVTVYKRKNQLYQLVTDQGFSSETGVVWETLSNIEGDSQFVDGRFQNVPPMADSEINSRVPESVQQIDTDYLVALSLHEDQEKEAEKTKSWDEYKEKLGLTNHSTDEELARRLQNEENTTVANVTAQRASEESKANKKKMCTIS